MDNTSLGDRIKAYEDCYRTYLPKRLPLILRLDGVHFHSYVKGCKKPFDQNLIDAMNETAMYLCKNIQGTKMAYLQSDEISLLMYNADFESEGWFGGNHQKIISVSAALASSYLTSISDKIFGKTKLAQFDSRCFIVPMDEVVNALEWRQQDASRNSIQMLARSLYSHKECNNKNQSQLQEMCFQKGHNWNDLPTYQRRGRCVVKSATTKTGFNPKTGETIQTERTDWVIDNEIPIFHKDREYIDKYLK